MYRFAMSESMPLVMLEGKLEGVRTGWEHLPEDDSTGNAGRDEKRPSSSA